MYSYVEYIGDLVTFLGLGSVSAVQDLFASTLFQCLLLDTAPLEEGKT